MPRILIAEDDAAIRQLLRTILHRHGFEIETAPDGGEALRLIAAAPFDLLLLDLMMPIVSGWKILNELDCAHHPLARNVVILTAAADSDLETIPASVPLLRKPFDLSELLTIIRKMTGQPSTPAPLADPSPSAIAEA